MIPATTRGHGPRTGEETTMTRLDLEYGTGRRPDPARTAPAVRALARRRAAHARAARVRRVLLAPTAPAPSGGRGRRARH